MIRAIREACFRLASALRKRELDTDFDEELAAHVDLLTQRNIKRGLSPVEARRQAILKLGGLNATRDLHRDARGLPSLERLLPECWQDVKYASRMIRHGKGWTVTIVLCLALGIGANAALFSGINGLFLRKLPVEDPDSLVRFRWTGDNDAVTDSSDYGTIAKENGMETRATFSYPMFEELRKANRTMVDLFACSPDGAVNLIADGRADMTRPLLCTGNYYAVLGAKAFLGRVITPEDDRPGAAPVAVISHKYWLSRFGGDPGVIGKVVQANYLPVTIVGVTAPEFTGIQTALSEPPEIGFPLALESQLSEQTGFMPERRLDEATAWWLQIMGRLKPGATREQVLGNLAGVFDGAARAHLTSYLGSLSEKERATSANRFRSKVPALRVSSGSRGVYDVDPAAVKTTEILSIVVALILLIVCANVANLLLSRAAARRREMSVRLSMGATRGRLIRQLLTESVLLAMIGGVVGAIAARWARQWLPGAAGRAPIDSHFFMFVSALALLTGLIFGIAPALQSTRRRVAGTLKETSRTVAGARSLLSKSLLVAQVAISLVLLIGSGLFLRTLGNLRRVDVGFDPMNLVLFRINPSINRYDQPRTASLFNELSERLKSLPGVRDVTVSNVALLSGSVNGTSMIVQGRSYTRGPNNINRVAVGANYFDLMKLPLVAGRVFTATDTQDAPPVAIINEAAARKFFPGEDPVGRRVGKTPEESGKMEIVGVIRDAKYNSLREPAPPTIYVPFYQNRLATANFTVRTAVDPASLMGSIRNVIRNLDPNIPSPTLTTQLDQIERRFEQERFIAQAYTLFGSLALFIASIGLFGVMSYNVARRTNEIGIRMALGAGRRDVVLMVMRESLILVFAGLLIGLGAAIAAGRLVTTLLFGLSATDPVTIAGAAGAMMAVAVCAGYLPARRASRVDPMTALHYE